MKQLWMDWQTFAEDAEAGQETGGETGGQAAPDAGEQEAFSALIRGQYKEQFDARVQKILDGRLRGLRQENARLRQEVGLTISVGVSFNKVFAKLGSDYKKPDATTVISRENWRDIVWPLPVGDLLFVGRAAQRTLGQYGVETIGQLAACKPEMLEQLMGKMGAQLYRYANGLDDAPVRPQHQREPVKSVGNSTTFPENLTRWEEIRSGLQLLSDSVAGRLRKEGLYCGGVAVAVKDAQFRTVSRQMRLGAPTHLMRDILEAAQELTRRIWKAPTPVRLLSVTALYITDSADSYQQLDLLAGDAPLRDQRQEQLESAMDTIRGKYGRDAIAFGRGGKVGWNKDE